MGLRKIYFVSELNGEEIVGTFYKKEQHKTNQKFFRVEKAIKRKGSQSYIKWKGYDNYFKAGLIKKT